MIFSSVADGKNNWESAERSDVRQRCFLAFFLRGRENAYTQGLGQIELAANRGCVVTFHLVLSDQTGHSQAEYRFGRVDRMPAG